MKALIFPKYNKTKFIDGNMAYILGGDNKYNIVLGRDYNT